MYQIYYIYIRSKIYLSETNLTMLFFIIKFVIFVGLIFYFDKIGSKIEKSSKTTTSWVVFFIPYYFFMVVLGIYIILKAFAEENDSWSILKHSSSSLIYYLSFLTSSILFPIKLDNQLSGMNFFVIPALNTFGSIYLMIHKTCFYNKI
jgi:hypothetical protein